MDQIRQLPVLVLHSYRPKQLKSAKIYGRTKTGRVGPFCAAKMVLGPNQAAIFGPAGPKFDPDQKIHDRPFLSAIKRSRQIFVDQKS